MDKHEALDLYRSMCGEEEQKSAGEPAPKFCSHCGRINDTGGRICSFCRESAKNSKKRRMAGERLRRPKGEASCQICGKLSVPGEKYCRLCLDFAPGGYVGEPSAKAAILPDNSAKANFSGENRSATIENPGVTDKKRSDTEKNESGARLCTRCGKPCDTGGKRCSTCRDYMRGNVAANREKAKQEGRYPKTEQIRVCTRCHMPVDTAGKLCSSCRDYLRGAAVKHKDKLEKIRNDHIETPRGKPVLSISDINKMAAERGISYGQMVLILERERDNENK